jgi:hypothetical protein
MAVFLVTSTHRECQPGESSGYIYTVDLERKQVTSRCPVIEPPHRNADPNPRGGMRGAKGIAIHEDHVFVANASVVYRFDASWNVVGSISHPSCASIHDIVIQDGTLWVASCCNDLVFQFDLEGRVLQVLNFRTYPELLEVLSWNPCNRLELETVLSGGIDFRDPRTHRHEVYDGAHINSLCFLPNGDLLVLLGLIRTRHWTAQLIIKDYLQKLGLWKLFVKIVGPPLRLLPLRRAIRSDVGISLAAANSAVVRVGRGGSKDVVWVLPERRTPTHSLLARPDGTIFLNDTSAGSIVHYDPERGKILAQIKVTDEFLRGICPLPNNRLLAGSQRDLLVVDPAAQTVLDRIRLSDNPNVSIYDIKMLPPGFGKLPERFVSEEAPGALVSCP